MPSQVNQQGDPKSSPNHTGVASQAFQTMFRPSIAALLAAALLTLSGCGSAPGPKYRNVSSYSEGLAAVQAANGKWGFVNERQHWVIAPNFEEAKPFQTGRAAVKQNGKWGFVNKRGDWQ